jgi:hypothetical protein
METNNPKPYPTREELLAAHRRKQNKMWLTLLGAVGVPVLLIIIFSSGDRDYSSQPARPVTHEDVIKQQFSGWDGSHKNLTKLIKDNMHDPSSYEHVETSYSEIDANTLYVTTAYRGNNAFGAKVLNKVEAEVSVDGKILKILSE